MRIRRISGLMPPAQIHRVEWYGPEKVRGAEPLKPPEPPPPDNADWAGYAQRRKVEGDLQGAARQAELQPGGKQDPVQQVLAAARRAGLTQTEVMQLRNHLNSVRSEVLSEDLKFLRNPVLRCPHPLQALRAFLEMTALAARDPLRMRRDVALTLVRAVADRSVTKAKSPVVPMTLQEASGAARALAGMTQEDFFHATRLLETVDEQSNRAAILKEIAAYQDSLVNQAINDLFRNMTGLPSYFLGEVQAHAADLLSKTGRVHADDISQIGLKEIRPSEYLKEGFFTPDGEMQAGIHGYCSAAMARRLKEEGTRPDTVRELVDVVSRIGEDLFELAGDDPELPLDDSTHASLKVMQEMGETESSPALCELLNASEPWLRQFRDLAALAVHLERILSHMAE